MPQRTPMTLAPLGQADKSRSLGGSISLSLSPARCLCIALIGLALASDTTNISSSSNDLFSSLTCADKIQICRANARLQHESIQTTSTAETAHQDLAENAFLDQQTSARQSNQDGSNDIDDDLTQEEDEEDRAQINMMPSSLPVVIALHQQQHSNRQGQSTGFAQPGSPSSPMSSASSNSDRGQGGGGMFAFNAQRSLARDSTDSAASADWPSFDKRNSLDDPTAATGATRFASPQSPHSPHWASAAASAAAQLPHHEIRKQQQAATTIKLPSWRNSNMLLGLAATTRVGAQSPVRTRHIHSRHDLHILPSSSSAHRHFNSLQPWHQQQHVTPAAFLHTTAANDAAAAAAAAAVAQSSSYTPSPLFAPHMTTSAAAYIRQRTIDSQQSNTAATTDDHSASMSPRRRSRLAVQRGLNQLARQMDAPFHAPHHLASHTPVEAQSAPQAQEVTVPAPAHGSQHDATSPRVSPSSSPHASRTSSPARASSPVLPAIRTRSTSPPRAVSPHRVASPTASESAVSPTAVSSDLDAKHESPRHAEEIVESPVHSPTASPSGSPHRSAMATRTIPPHPHVRIDEIQPYSEEQQEQEQEQEQWRTLTLNGPSSPRSVQSSPKFANLDVSQMLFHDRTATTPRGRSPRSARHSPRPKEEEELQRRLDALQRKPKSVFGSIYKRIYGSKKPSSSSRSPQTGGSSSAAASAPQAKELTTIEREDGWTSVEESDDSHSSHRSARANAAAASATIESDQAETKAPKA